MPIKQAILFMFGKLISLTVGQMVSFSMNESGKFSNRGCKCPRRRVSAEIHAIEQKAEAEMDMEWVVYALLLCWGNSWGRG